MKVDILNIEATTKEESLQEVTNPIYFIKDNIPTDDGLFSYKIFGRPGSKERESRYAYINLKKRFIHPMVFDLLKNLGNAFENIMLSKKFYKLSDSNELIENPENGETGIEFLYKNWNKIYIKDTGTKSRNKKMSLKDEIKINEAFITKMIVSPASIRDFNPNSSSGSKSSSSDEVNRMYSKLLMLTNSLTGYDMGMSISNMITESSIQLLINEIYIYFLEKMAHKNGHIHQALLSKTVDYSTRSVISAPNFSPNDYKKQEVPFGYAGVPLTQLVVLFYPFYVNFIQNFMLQHEMDIKIIHYKNKKVEDVTNNISLRDIFDEELIKNLLNLFVRTEQYRFQRIRIENSNGQTFQLEMFKEELGRDFTLMDLIYLATDEIIADKHVYLTRYPIETRLNILPCRIKILSTKQTVEMTINSKYFDNYPYIIPDYPCQNKDLIMTVLPNNSYLGELGGDYDGDTVSLRSVFTREANEEAERLLMAKSNVLDQNGKLIRNIGNDAMQAIYALTRE